MTSRYTVYGIDGRATPAHSGADARALVQNSMMYAGHAGQRVGVYDAVARTLLYSHVYRAKRWVSESPHASRDCGRGCSCKRKSRNPRKTRRDIGITGQGFADRLDSSSYAVQYREDGRVRHYPERGGLSHGGAKFAAQALEEQEGVRSVRVVSRDPQHLTRRQLMALAATHAHQFKTKSEYEAAYNTLIPQGYIDASGTWKLTPKGLKALRSTRDEVILDLYRPSLGRSFFA